MYMKMFQHQQYNHLSQRHLRQTGQLVQLTHQLLLRENRDKLNKSLTMHFYNGCQELLIKQSETVFITLQNVMQRL